MNLFVFILLTLSGSVFLTRLAASLSVPYPSLLALGGALVALVPGIPHLSLDPDVALAIFVAPVLLDASYDISLRDLNDNRIPIITLVLVAVAVTTIAVAVVFRAIVPDVPWAAAIALGAIVAPPDAAAATAVLKRVDIPHRLVLILEGESLFNDASALLIFAVAVNFADDGHGSFLSLLPLYVASVIGSVVTGVLLARFIPRAFSVLRDTPALIVGQFVGTFAVWVLAQKLYLSPILTVAAYGIAVARSAGSSDALTRVQSYAVWDTIVFVMNVLAFSLIGLQLGPLLTRLGSEHRGQVFIISAVILLTVIVVRIVWVMTFNSVLRLKNRVFGVNLRERIMRPTAAGGVLIAWSGMRGIVTLAAALSLPENFPQRDAIQFVSFTVVLGTLVIQGFTLRPLARLLRLPKDTQIDAETRFAKREVLRAAIASIDGDHSAYANGLRAELNAALEVDGVDGEGERSTLNAHEELRIRAAKAGRDVLISLRRNGEIGDDAFHRIEQALDRSELYASRYASSE